MGTIGIAIWLLPSVLHAWTGCGDHSPLLAAIGCSNRLSGFNPTALMGVSESPSLFGAILALRFIRLVVVVPLVEEIFWRGFLMRVLSERAGGWWEMPLAHCDGRSVLLTSLLFGAAHWGPDFAVALIYGLLAGVLARRTGNLWAAVLMHAVSNAILGGFVVWTGWFGLW